MTQMEWLAANYPNIAAEYAQYRNRRIHWGRARPCECCGQMVQWRQDAFILGGGTWWNLEPGVHRCPHPEGLPIPETQSIAAQTVQTERKLKTEGPAGVAL